MGLPAGDLPCLGAQAQLGSEMLQTMLLLGGEKAPRDLQRVIGSCGPPPFKRLAEDVDLDLDVMADYLATVDADLGLHHAIAFERLTGWPVHGTFVGTEAIRYHNEDGWLSIFDARGIMLPKQHSGLVIGPIVSARPWPWSAANQDGHLEIGCKCLGEEGVIAKGAMVSRHLLEQADAAIRANRVYLDLVQFRGEPRFPASALHRYAFGRCVIFAEALAKVRGLPAVTMLPTGTADWTEIKADQMQHAAVLHPDGDLEDVWGKAPVKRIADRYGFTHWRLSEEAHKAMISEVMVDGSVVIDEIAEAEGLIRACLGA